MGKGRTAYWKGKKMPLSARMKMSKNLLGNKRALGHKIPEKCLLTSFQKGHIPWNKGKKGLQKHSEESRKLISEAQLGQKNRKFWLGKFGDKHPRWIKDRTKLKKSQQRHDSAYKEWRNQVKKRDGKCQLLNDNCSGYLTVHHILGWAEYPKERYNVDNGITLCKGHHPRKRADEKRLVPVFQGLIINNK